MVEGGLQLSGAARGPGGRLGTTFRGGAEPEGNGGAIAPLADAESVVAVDGTATGTSGTLDAGGTAPRLALDATPDPRPKK